MKRLLSLFLLLTVLLTSCGFLSTDSDDPVRFSDITYHRPDVDDYAAKVEDAVSSIRDGNAGYMKLITLLNEEFERYNEVYTMDAYASTRYSLNMADTFFGEEEVWLAENLPRIDELHERFLIAAAESEHCEKLENEYIGIPGFLTDYLEHPLYTNPAYLACEQEENALVEQYRALLADPVIEWKGKELHVDLLGEDETIPAEDYYEIYETYYRRYNALAGGIFLSLMDVRARKAEAAGYDSYAELAGAELGRGVSYRTVSAYLDSLCAAFVPLQKEIEEAGIGYAAMPELGEEEVKAKFDQLCEKYGEPFVTVRDLMTENGLLDMEPSVNKEDMSFTVYFSSYSTPFIFINPYGTADDLSTLTHEFGHFCDMMINYGGTSDVDLSECYSVSLALLSSLRMDGILDEETAEDYRVNALLDAVDTMLYQGLYADFEAQVYLSGDVKTVEDLNRIFREVSVKWGVIDETDDTYYELLWFEIPHLFLYPTYVPSYCLATECALRFLELEALEEGAGIDAYVGFLYRDDPYGSLEGSTVDAGVHSPLTVGASEESADLIRLLLGLTEK